MSLEQQDAEAAARGREAEREFAETRAAFERVRQAAVASLIATAPGQEAVRERLVVTCQILDAVQSALMDVVNSGKLAEHAIAQRNLLRR